jgi:transposase-like protein
MTKRPHRRYSTEFKLQLVQSYLDEEGSLRTIGRKHGVAHSLLRVWIDKYERGELAEEVQL